MVVLTAVYVIATIAICLFNYKSAQATREQVAESARQFEETNRAFVTVYADFIRNGLFVLCVSNSGNKPAKEINVNIGEEYFKNIFEYSTVGKSITSLDGQIKTNKTFFVF